MAFVVGQDPPSKWIWLVQKRTAPNTERATKRGWEAELRGSIDQRRDSIEKRKCSRLMLMTLKINCWMHKPTTMRNMALPLQKYSKGIVLRWWTAEQPWRPVVIPSPRRRSCPFLRMGQDPIVTARWSSIHWKEKEVIKSHQTKKSWID